jgi:hypothetical protein
LFELAASLAMAKTAREKKSPKEKAKAAKDLFANSPDILEEVDVKHTIFFVQAKW